ncbi:MAG: glycosyltransferase [Chlorobi bacterium]|nr:glycosyltransferase [Chlorobiota bacterium]
MRIFVLLPRVPYPLEKGDKLRAFNQVKELSKSNEIILCALNPVKKLDKQKAFSSLQPYCRSVNFIDIPLPGRIWNTILAFFGNRPLQTGYFYNRKAARRIKNLIKYYKPDHLYCQLVRTAEYIKNIPVPKTLDYQDVFSYGAKRRMERSSFPMKQILKVEYLRLKEYENKIFDYFDHKTIISKPDRDLIPHKKKEEITIIPNGVDHQYFKPREETRTFDLVFTGNMGYPPNVDAAEFLTHEIMPEVWKIRPDTRLLLAGATPDRKVKALHSNKIVVTGWLDDIRDAYASAKIFIAPMRIGTGLQNKLLEAMSMKIPSITTPLANDALQAKDGEEILLGKTAGELAGQILRLLNDDLFYEKIAENGHKFVKTNYDWAAATEKLNKLIRETV